jgi:hypothetical protein
LKRVEILKAKEVEVEDFKPYSFLRDKEHLSSVEPLEYFQRKNSKKSIKRLAQKSNLPYNEEKILFTIDIINMMLNEINDGK